MSSLPIIVIWLLSLAAGLAGGYFGRAFASSQLRKRIRTVESSFADLESSFESLLESHKRLRSRAGMRELRSRQGASDGSPPAEGASKAELRRYYGIAAAAGNIGPRAERRVTGHVPSAEG